MRPVISPDTAFFWAGTAVGELRVQSCGDCGTLRHPPGPLCMACGSPNPKYIVAAGTGEVFSYVVHHHPPVPGKKLPLVIALVELTEGVRVLAELTGVDPDKVEVGMPVEVSFIKVDDELVLPAWRPALRRRGMATGTRPVELPQLTVDVSTTFVVASALATRDFTKVHHDRDFAVASGSKDIFVNILTTTGLVQRFVSAWVGHQAIFRSIKIRSELKLAAEAVLAALDDAGLRPSDVSGLVTFVMDSNAEVAIARELGIGELTFFSQIGYGGGAACATVHQAAMAVATGAADVVVCYRAMNERSGRRFG
jgi:uncharacterized OB-fold protein